LLQAFETTKERNPIAVAILGREHSGEATSITWEGALEVRAHRENRSKTEGYSSHFSYRRFVALTGKEGQG
jgi:hypothetical protein